MKHKNTVVTLLVAAAILLGAYGIGLLVRQARMDARQREAAAEEMKAHETTVGQQVPGSGRTRRADAKAHADTRKQKEQMLTKMKSMTQEQGRELVEERVLDLVGAREGRGRFRELSEEERGKVMRAWQNLSEQEQKALKDRLAKDAAEPNEAAKVSQ